MKSQILRLFVSTFSVTVLARLTQLGLASVLGRAIGSEGYGVFVYALGLAALVQQVAGLGMPPMTLRFIPSYLQENKHALAKGFLITSEIILILTTLIATLAVLGVVKFAPLRPELAAGLALGALVIMPRGLLRLRNSQSTAIKRPGTGSFWELLAPNLLTLVFAFVAHYDAARPIVQFYAAAAVISFALATVGVYRRLWPRVGETSATFETGTWLKAGVPAMLSIAARNMINRVDIVLIAPLSNMQQVGLFGVSSQLSNLLTFPQFILNSVMAPRYSESYTSKNFNKLRRDFLLAISFALLTTIPLAAFLLTFGSEILAILFGAAFEQAQPTLSVLAIAQVFAAVAQAPISLLLMTGRETLLLSINVAALLVNIVINILLLPSFGAVGAGYARLVALAIVLVCTLIGVIRLMRKGNRLEDTAG